MNFLFGKFVQNRGAIGLAVVRLVFGLGIMLHGSAKIQAPFSWMDAFAGANAPPGILQAFAAVAEFFGGLALILGLLTPVASFSVALVMLAAIGMAHLPASDPFVGAPGQPSYELAVAVLLTITGPGALSLDWLLFGRRRAPNETDK